ncbi:MAG TPA: hypothetical protein PKZ07_19730 [Sedimentisphaerales bacterium]|nr:hypothetical protein [Sedimentisphaerales bacterium]
MALTITKEYSNIGSKQMVNGTIMFDSSYPTGGESFDPDVLFGVHDIDYVMIENRNGYFFEYDAANKKIKAFSPRQMPPIIYDEHQVLDSNYQLTTNYPAAYFNNIASKGQNLKWRSTGIAQTSLAEGECCLASAMAYGTKTTITVSPVNLTSYGAIGDGTGWTAGTNWSFSGGKAVKAAGASSGTLSEDASATNTIVIGHTYRIIYTISSRTAGGVTVSIGGTDGTARTADGTYTEDIVASTTGGLIFTPASDASALSIDDVYIYDLDVYLHYITQGWTEVWDNLVQDEEKTLATGANNLASGNKIAALMYVDQTTATAARLIPIDEDDTVASGEVDVKFNSATAQLTVHSDQNAKTVKVTYLKVPATGFMYDRKFSNEGATKSGSNPYINQFDYPILIWGYSGCMPVNGGSTIYMLQYWDTAATGEFTVDWFTPGVRATALAPSYGTACSLYDNVTGTGAGIWGMPAEIPILTRYDAGMEVTNATDLSGLGALRYIVVGT